MEQKLSRKEEGCIRHGLHIFTDNGQPFQTKSQQVNKSTSQQMPFSEFAILGVLFLIFYIYYNIYKI